MLEFFRSFMKSKFGLGITFGFLVLIALAFASADVSSSGTFGGVSGDDRAASVGSRKIGTAALSQGATTALERIKQEDPRQSMQAFLARGGLTEVLDQMIDRAAITEFGKAHGIVAGTRLVDSEIAKIAAFRGVDGKFSEAAYKAMLAQRGLSDASVREDLGDGLVARQVLVPAGFGAKVPGEMARRYAALLTETRVGAIALVPAAVYAPKGEPDAATLQAFYNANRAKYLRPERRSVRYAVFGADVIKVPPVPTDAEVAARYKADAAKYAASETRRLTQLVVPTEAAGKAILDEVAEGASLDAAARGKGLATAALGPLAQGALAGQSSAEVAAAAFGAAQGRTIGPVRSPLGWHLIHIDAVTANPGKTLDQAKAEIVTALAAEKKRAALSDFSARIEDEFDNGGSLTDVAKELGLTLATTEPLTADGKVYGSADKTAPPVLARALATAFSMEREGEPQLAEIEPGKTFIVFDVTTIAPSAAAPLADIRADVATDWKLQQGAKSAKAASEKLLASVKKGASLAQAMGALGMPLPPVDQITMSRAQLAQAGQQGVPRPLALLFSMAQGTTKLLAAPNNRGWYVVSLAKIEPGAVTANSPIIAQAARELSEVAGREYSDQLRAAIRAEVGVKRNQTSIDAVAKQLTGS